MGYSPWGHEESDTTERAHITTTTLPYPSYANCDKYSVNPSQLTFSLSNLPIPPSCTTNDKLHSKTLRIVLIKYSIQDRKIIEKVTYENILLMYF